ncbi:MAG: multiheme c-type cytochrome [Gammaproteobacteria bacterium]
MTRLNWPARLALLLLPLLLMLGVLAQINSTPVSIPALPEADGYMHMGVATCASGVCHGQSTPSDSDNVLMTEYRTWLGQDLHSRAYNSLLGPAARLMAENLGLDVPPHRAQICLDCHTDSVPENLRGPEFLLSDGEGCESCHGGAENWLESHRENATHADNIARGLYPTENPVAQVSLCLSCHNGTDNKLATHEIMGAGHPRLSFEMEAYAALQPMHYTVDEDYRARKNSVTGFGVWVTGQFEMALQSLELMNTYVLDSDAMQPELYFYDCQACHHPLEDKRWRPGAHGNLPPGTVRLNDASFIMIQSLLEIVSPDRVAEVRRLTDQLHLSSMVSKSALRSAADNLHRYLDNISAQFIARPYSDADLNQFRANLVRHAANGDFRDYSVAEQALLAIDGITIRLAQSDQYQSVLDALFQAMVLEDFSERGFVVFNPDRFVQIARQVEPFFNQ